MNPARCLRLNFIARWRIKCWSSENLSYAGGVQLINSILFSLHVYWSLFFAGGRLAIKSSIKRHQGDLTHAYQSSVFPLPRCLINEIEIICRKFFWSQHSDYSKSPPAVREFVCRSKKVGSLVIKNWNYVAVTKHLWTLTCDQHCLWLKRIHEVWKKISDQCPIIGCILVMEKDP